MDNIFALRYLTQHKYLENQGRIRMVRSLPIHEKPSPKYPGLHTQANEPSTFVHVACAWHGLLLHSFISKKEIESSLGEGR